MEIWY